MVEPSKCIEMGGAAGSSSDETGLGMSFFAEIQIGSGDPSQAFDLKEFG